MLTVHSRYLDFLRPPGSRDQVDKGLRQTALEILGADEDQDGCINFDEFKTVVQTSMPSSPPRSEAQLRTWFKELDTDDDGQIKMAEFFAFSLRASFMSMSNTASGPHSLEHFIKQWDKDGDGRLDRKEFAKLCERVGFGGLAGTLMAEVDTDGSGSVSATELIKILRKAPRHSEFFSESSRMEVSSPTKPDSPSSPGSMAGSTTPGLALDERWPSSAKDTACHEAGSADELEQELLDVLAANGQRILDMLYAWNLKKDDIITVLELGKILKQLTIDVPADTLLRLLRRIERETTRPFTVVQLNW